VEKNMKKIRILIGTFMAFCFLTLGILSVLDVNAIIIETDAIIYSNTVTVAGNLNVQSNLNMLNNMVTNATYSIISTPSILLATNGVAIVTPEYGDTIVLNLTNNPTTLTFADSFPTTVVNRCSIEINVGTNSLILSNMIFYTAVPVFSTNSVSASFFRKSMYSTNWYIRQ
jgi:hypothetical protein